MICHKNLNLPLSSHDSKNAGAYVSERPNPEPYQNSLIAQLALPVPDRVPLGFLKHAELTLLAVAS